MISYNPSIWKTRAERLALETGTAYFVALESLTNSVRLLNGTSLTPTETKDLTCILYELKLNYWKINN